MIIAVQMKFLLVKNDVPEEDSCFLMNHYVSSWKAYKLFRDAI